MKRVSKVYKTLAIVLTTSLSYILSVSSVLARAGGGENFGDGGFDIGGGGGGFDFGGGSTITPGVFNTGSSGSPSAFFVVLAIIIILIIISSRRRKGQTGNSGAGLENNTTSPTHSSQNNTQVANSIKKLKEVDPKFDEQKFKTHAKKVFMAVQEGWTLRDQTICRPFMAEEVYQSHQIQIDDMRRNGIINKLESIVVGSTNIVRVDIDEEYHKLSVKIRASMKDYKVKEDSPEKIIEGDRKQSPPFTEYWIFIRRSNLKTKDKNGIFDRKCPNCGAPIQVDVSGICKYCDANVVNGDYDWVLSEIVQRSEWTE